MTKYILVLWPESQEYMEKEGVYLAPVEAGDSAYFVPEKYLEEN